MIEDPITHELVPDVNEKPDVSDGSSIAESAESEEVYHRCQWYESLESVAIAHGLTVDDLLSLNAGNPGLTLVSWPVGSIIRVK